MNIHARCNEWNKYLGNKWRKSRVGERLSLKTGKSLHFVELCVFEFLAMRDSHFYVLRFPLKFDSVDELVSGMA